MLKKILIGIVILTVILISIFIYNDEDKEEIVIKPKAQEEVIINDSCYVDIKGEVVKSGVYECVKDDKVIDIINKAGGLTKNADTSLINLSKKVFNEMLILVYSKKQIEAAKKRLDKPKIIEIIKEIEKECVCIDDINDACEIPYVEVNEDSVNNNSKININSASKEELMTLPKIGEAKAKSIIEYRTTTKFNKIEDIKNVSGIGDSLFNDIKNLIEV